MQWNSLVFEIISIISLKFYAKHGNVIYFLLVSSLKVPGPIGKAILRSQPTIALMLPSLWTYSVPQIISASDQFTTK